MNISSISSSIAAMAIRKRLEAGHKIEFPSLGIVIEGDKMTKRKTVSTSIAAKDNRQAAKNFDQLGFTDDELISQLEKRGWWGYLSKGVTGEARGIEVRNA